MARANDDGGIGACIAQCIISCIASIMEYFNKWAFIYVGVYGFGYLEAGKSVFELFKNRGWEAIIADVRKVTCRFLLFPFPIAHPRSSISFPTGSVRIDDRTLFYVQKFVRAMSNANTCPTVFFLVSETL